MLRTATGLRNGHLSLLEIGTNNQKILENLKSASWFRSIDLILATTLCSPVWLSHCLQFAHVHSFVCRLTLRNLRAHCSTVALCCVSTTWQGTFKGSLQITTVNVFFRMWLLTSHIFGRWCSETVNADNGKARCFILCEKKHEWIYSNAAASTCLKNLNQAKPLQAFFHTAKNYVAC